LLDEGNTVPFITRYRKDQTGALDDEQVRQVQAKVAKLRALAERKSFRAAQVPLTRLAELREPTLTLIEQVGLR